MNDQQAFEKLKLFFETQPTSLEASSYLKSGTEVGVIIGDTVECVFFRDEGGKPHFERRPAENADFIFTFSPDAIENLVAGEYSTMADVAINITKNFLAGTVKFNFVGAPTNVLTRGYLNVLKAGGVEYTKFLSSLGLPAISKITAFLFKR